MKRSRPSYLWAAFKARPLGMPIPPNWFGLAAFGLLGAFVSPGFWVLGAGLEIAYLYTLSKSERFRRVVDAEAYIDDPAERGYRELLDALLPEQRARQHAIEAQSAELLRLLERSPLMSSHAGSLEQLVWLHLRLLAARTAIARVVQTASQEHLRLRAAAEEIDARLTDVNMGQELRRSLEQQRAVIDARQSAHTDAGRRQEHIDAELVRIEQQIALIREQTLLATNEEHLGHALDALTSSFNEANRWLGGQRDLLGVLDLNDLHSLPERVLRSGASEPSATRGELQ